MRKQTNLLQGTLDLLIFKTLALGQMHGLGIANRIGQITNGRWCMKDLSRKERVFHPIIRAIVTAIQSIPPALLGMYPPISSKH